ncbi:excinuclease ABC subunit UvrC [Candidatus Woesearchaeota archaeon]|nr:excinuclease ABC subunit UvrC [Candidatus Woesearchaeota archaeon]MCF8013019.1 excinuclease ABC subunit UvrC [Candidatus Woesearchaeota archaeon]
MKPDLTQIPTNPGCYIYKNLDGDIIYVGKAKNIKKRVTSYFTKKHTDTKNPGASEKTVQLVKRIKYVEFVITNTETEALLLENNLIKKHKPKYNIDLKDSKRYAYLLLTDEEFPRILTARDKKEKGQYFGPFTSGETRLQIRDFLIKTFQIRTCKRLPKKECLRYHIGICSAPCTHKITKEKYLEDIEKAKQILSGKTKEIIKQLESEMKKYALETNYEAAKHKKNQIDALLYLDEKQNMERNRKYNEDILNFVIKQDKVYLMVFNIYKGILENKEEYIFENEEDFLEKFLIQYYDEKEIPKEIILPKEINDGVKKELQTQKLTLKTNTKKEKLKFTVPEIGEKKQLLNLILKNIENAYFLEDDTLEELQKELKLHETPEIIECFDISHLSGTSTVASMVQFKNAKTDKNNYRRFKIRTVEGIDDFASIAEVVRRRYTKLKTDNLQMPNLIVIDGGKGQLSAAIKELEKLRLNTPIISLAKREEEIFMPGNPKPIILNKKSKSLKLLQRIRDEAHRFAITYNRNLRKKEIK